MTVYKYSLIENYFEDINTEEKAYWLGYILADGCVKTRTSKDRRFYGLVLASIDLDHLEKFKATLEYTGPITAPKRSGGFLNSKQCYYLRISRVKLSKDLLKYKPDSSNITIPKIRKDLERHLIRGFFDGDGSVYSWIRNSKSNNLDRKCPTQNSFALEASIICCDSMLKDIKNKLDDLNIRNRVKPSKCDSMNYLVVSNGPDLREFRKYLYKDSFIYMQRKFDKWHNTPPEWETIQRKS